MASENRYSTSDAEVAGLLVQLDAAMRLIFQIGNCSGVCGECATDADTLLKTYQASKKVAPRQPCTYPDGAECTCGALEARAAFKSSKGVHVTHEKKVRALVMNYRGEMSGRGADQLEVEIAQALREARAEVAREAMKLAADAYLGDDCGSNFTYNQDIVEMLREQSGEGTPI